MTEDTSRPPQGNGEMDLYTANSIVGQYAEWLDHQWTIEEKATALRALNYNAYLRTHWWVEIRRKAMLRAGERCQLCNRRDGWLDGHHRSYERLGYPAELEDVIILCRSCHRRHHIHAAKNR